MQLFPGQYIHIGGDEVPKDSWKHSAFCHQLMKEKDLKDYEELQSYFIRRIDKFVHSKGRQIIGWDEIMEGGLAPQAVVESWHGTKKGIAAAKQGHDVIMAPRKHVYFDYLQGNEDQEPIAIGGYNPLEDVYSYNPTPISLTPQVRQHILGVEACVWTEYIPTVAKAEYMILPRMLALSEIAWTPLHRKNYTNFLTVRLPVQLAKLDTSNILYRVPQTIGIKDTTLSGGKFTLNLKPSVKGATIYYTLDGYKPDRTTFKYDKTLTIKVPKGQTRILKTRVITPSGKRSNITTTTFRNK
jgi:hexosaminidase